jgi:hypothetical protein
MWLALGGDASLVVGVVTVRVVTSGFSGEDFGFLFIHDFPDPPCLNHYLLNILISLEELLFW